MIHYKGEHGKGGDYMPHNGTVWIVEVYEGGVWRVYGNPSTDFAKLYSITQKFCMNGTKARIVKYTNNKA